MAYQNRAVAASNVAPDVNISVDDGKLGVIRLVQPSRLPKNAVAEAINLMQVDEGRWKTRWGSQGYGDSYFEVVNTSRTNLCENPSLETDATYWSVSGTSAILTRETSDHSQGTACAHLNKNNASGNGFLLYKGIINVARLVTLTLSVDIKVSKDVASLQLRLFHITGSGNNVIATSFTSYTTTEGWKRFHCSGITLDEDGPLWADIRLQGSGDVYADGMLIEASSTDDGYFDGGFTDIITDPLVIDYAWTGTANLSPSTASKTENVPLTIDGAKEYVKYNSDGTRDTELLVAAGGKIFSSSDGSPADELMGAEYTAGTPVEFQQSNAFMYMATGLDPLMRYDGSVLSSYETISSPNATSAVATGLSAGAFQAYYQVVAVSEVGMSTPSDEMSVSGGTDKPREQWINGTDYITVTWTAPTDGATNVVRYEIYYSDQSGFECFLTSVEADVLSWVDDGTNLANPYIETPTDNTTTGPYFSSMCLSGNRFWGSKDPNNPYRAYWSGTGSQIGAFTHSTGGGWIDLDYGGNEATTAVAHYRTGKGDDTTLVFTSDPEGKGSIWQVNITTETLTNSLGTSVTIIIPTTQKITGSVGSSAVRSVVQAKDNIYYWNNKGMFSTGSKPSLLNVLSTDEVSANIRPYVQELIQGSVNKTAAYYFDAKIFISVAHNSVLPDHTIILDLERKNWSVYWTFGAMQFLEYTDSTNATHFLSVSTTGNQLVELSPGFRGDNGQAFNTSLLTGLITIDARDRTKWGKIRYGYIEVSDGSGKLQFEILGVNKKGKFSTIAQREVVFTDNVSTSGFGADQYSTIQYGTSNASPIVASAPSTVKRLRVNKVMNNVQFRVSSNGLNTQYTILRLQAKGYQVPTRDPSIYKK